MTNAPSDLLALRAAIKLRTGLSDVEVGIVGDSRHAASGGYHEGRTDLERAGVLATDYSVRLPRDKAGLTESASAMDIDADWHNGGRAAWETFSLSLVAALTRNDPALVAIRAVNYTDARGRLRRVDREAGWQVFDGPDAGHTHIEWYRDTEGRRQACLDRLVALVDQAVNGVVLVSTPPAPITDRSTEDIVDALPTLQRGATGDAVRVLEGLLIGHGYPTAADDPKAVDGEFGPTVEASVRRFQEDRRLTVDGIVGTGQTWPGLLNV